MNNVKVRCYSGYTFAEKPEYFIWQGNRYDIQEIEKEWFEPGEKCFQVRAENNKMFRLCYNEANDRWSMIGAEER